MLLRSLVIFVIIVLASGCASTVITQPQGAEAVVPTTIQPPPKLQDSGAYYAVCGGQVRSVANILEPIVQDMVSRTIPYTKDPSNEWRDCSGVFLRLSSYVAAACPEQQRSLAAPPGIRPYVEGGNNNAPISGKARTSREIAKWYESQGRFTPIYYDGITSSSQIPTDLRKYRNLIRPGALVWFSLARPSSADDLSGLFEKQVSRGPHINHMATVTSVTRDADDNVIGYEVFHGRSRKNPASVTKTHFWKWPTTYLKCSDSNDRSTCSKEYPTLGYWNQYLVGIGTLMPEPTTLSAN